MTEKEIKILREVRDDLRYQIDAKHGPEKASKYPSIVKADAILEQYDNKKKMRDYLGGKTHYNWAEEGSYWRCWKLGLRDTNEAYRLEMLKYCENCVNRHDDPQMCLMCVSGSHQTLGQ